MDGVLTVWATRAIPTVLIGIIGYVSWVVTRAVVVKNQSHWRPISIVQTILVIPLEVSAPFVTEFLFGGHL